MEPELKICKRCGGTPTTLQNIVDIMGQKHLSFRVFCKSCAPHNNFFSKVSLAEAVGIWNGEN